MWLVIRRWRKQHRRHIQESDLRDNKRLQDSYHRHPVRLIGIFVGDVYIGDDIARLDEHLCQVLPSERGSIVTSWTPANIHQFLTEAREAASRGQAGMYGRPYVRKGSSMFGVPVPWIPKRAESVTLTLNDVGSGVVVFGAYVVAEHDIAREVFTFHHARPVVKQRRGWHEYTVELAKARAFARELVAMSRLPVFPPKAGILRHSRYPHGATVLWALSKFADADDREWRDVARVMGARIRDRWENSRMSFHVGVPSPSSDRTDEQGFSAIVLSNYGDADADGTGGDHEDELHRLKYETYLSFAEWLQWPTVFMAASQISREATGLRARLDGLRASWLTLLGLRPFEGLVDKLVVCRYSLNRLRQVCNEDERRFTDIPKLEWVHPFVSAAHPSPGVGKSLSPFARALTTLRQLGSRAASRGGRRGQPEGVATPPTADGNREHLAQSMFHWFDGLAAAAMEDMQLSLDRANALAQLAAPAALRTWTIAITFFTLLTLIVTVWQASHPGNSGSPIATPSPTATLTVPSTSPTSVSRRVRQ